MGETLKNDRKRQVAKALALGAAGALADFSSTTGYMHRDLTHKAFRLRKPLRTLARIVMWGTGTRPRVWATVHRKHHDNADVEGDPHSPFLLGRYGVVKLFFKNTFMYSKEARDVERADVYDEDLQPDELDRIIFDKTKLGPISSFVGYVLLNKAIGNPGYMGAISWATEKLLYIKGGDAVNSIGHGGMRPFKSMVTGKIEPHEDGSYGADSRLVALVTLGEGNQKFHHENPGSLYFGENPNAPLPARAARDLGGTVAMGLIKLGLAEKGKEPPQRTAA